MSEPRNHRFSIMVKRMRGDYSEEEIALMSEKERRYLNGRLSVFWGTSFVQLEDAEQNKRTFAFTSKSPQYSASGESAPLSSLTRAFDAVPISSRKGTVIEAPGKAKFYDDRIDYAITEKQYATLLNELENNKHRVYNILFRNCATFAVEVAGKAGLEVPSKFLVTPTRLSNAIEKMAEEREKLKDTFQKAEEKISAMFSEQELAPTPSRNKGQPVTLMDRLKKPGGLGL
jgi:hypothetical protein